MQFTRDTWYADRTPVTVYMTIHDADGTATIHSYEDATGVHMGEPDRPLLMGLRSLYRDAQDYAYYNWED